MSASFSPDYSTARDRFRALAIAAGTALESHEIDARGPGGEVLTVDVARHGGTDCSRCLVLSSGLHGVEGFVGSAVQLRFLEEWAASESRPNDVAIVLIHALNPYGFAWRRRVDHENIDPNRNFLLPGEAFEGSPPSYAKLDGLLNPPRPPARYSAFAIRAAGTILRHGMKPLKQAVAGGQHDFPLGLFYGGKQPAMTQRILAANLKRWVGGARTVLHLDYHTGLGKWGTHRLLVDQLPSGPQQAWLGAHFRGSQIEPFGTQGVSYRIRGHLGGWCRAHLSECDYTAVGPEFGTYGPLRIIAGLRAENQAHHFCDPHDKRLGSTKQRLTELFCPKSPAWRRKVLADGAWSAWAGLRALVAGYSS